MTETNRGAEALAQHLRRHDVPVADCEWCPEPETIDGAARLREEFEYRIRTAIAYGIGRGKRGEHPDDEWVQHQIDAGVFQVLAQSEIPPRRFAVEWTGYRDATCSHQAQMLADAGLVATETQTQTEWGMYVPAFEECPTGADVFDTEGEARMRARYEVESRWAMGNPIAIARREVTPWRTVEAPHD